MATQKKIDIVTDLTKSLTGAKAIVFTDYRGMTHKQLEEFRKTLKKVKGQFVIAKNTLLFKALTNAKYEAENIEKDLTGPTGTLIALEDEVAPIKELAKSIKLLQLPVIKFAFWGKNKLAKEQVTRLATLPNREMLLGQLVGQLNSPIQGLHYALSWSMLKLVYALNAVKNKKV